MPTTSGAFRRIICVVAGVLCSWPLPAQAQTEVPERPFVGLFGGAPGRKQAKRSVVLAATFSGSHDDNILGEGSFDDPRLQLGGSYSFLNTELLLGQRRQGLAVDGRLSVTARYYPQLAHPMTTSYSGETGLGMRLDRRTGVQLRGAGGSIPYFGLDAFSQLASSGVEAITTTGDRDFGIIRREIRSYNTSADVTRTLSPRSNLEMTYSWRSSNITGERVETAEQSVDVRAQHRVSRTGAMELGYLFRDGSTAAPSGLRRFRAHEAILGGERELLRSRTGLRTIVKFALGPGVIEDGNNRVRRVMGSAALDHQFARSWSTGITYRRDVGVQEGFDRLVAFNSGTVRLEGLLMRRVELRVSGGYSAGLLGLDVAANQYDTYGATTRLRVALSRSLALTSEYRRYHYRFIDLTGLPAGYPRELNQQGVRLGVTFWIPLHEG